MSYVGRFAPSPSGRMHLGNVYAALMAWLFAKSNNGEILLRIEDIDLSRCKPEYTEILKDDLNWLGITFEEGRVLHQSKRADIYEKALCALREKGLLYPCFCTRADLHAASAPHEADGRSIYSGRCRLLTDVEANEKMKARQFALRCAVPNTQAVINDHVYGVQRCCLPRDWGDFIVKRADNTHAYQLAAAVDDGESSVTHIVRGRDLLSSAALQEYLKSELGYNNSEYAHLPLLLAPDGKRLSKREKSLDMGALRQKYTPAQLLGRLAFITGLISREEELTAKELIKEFSPLKLGTKDITVQSIF